MLLGDAIITFLKQGQAELLWSPNTTKGYEVKLRLLYRYFGNIQVESITANDIHDWRGWIANKDYRGGKIGDVSKFHYGNTCRVFFGWLQKQGYSVLDISQIPIRKPVMRERQNLNDQDLVRLLEAPNPESKFGIRDKALLELMFSTGMRLSEVISINLQDINLERQEATIVGKGGRQRAVFVSDRAKDALEKWLKIHPRNCEALFTTLRIGWRGEESIKRISQRSIACAIKKYGRKIGIDLHPHMIRHTFATFMLNRQVDLYALKNMLGHQQLTTTQVYLHHTNPKLREIHRKAMVLR